MTANIKRHHFGRTVAHADNIGLAAMLADE